MNGNPPNLLFLYTDEQACATLAAYGNRQIQMPNLNRLAAQSTIFERAYVTQPVCTPSRSSLLTGLYPHSNGCTENNLRLPPEVPCLPEMLPRGGYATGHFGKWHLGDELFAQHGFAEWISIEDNYNAYFSPGCDRSQRSTYHAFLARNGHIPTDGQRFGRGEAARLPEHLGKPAYLANEAIRFLQSHRFDPFVLYVNFLEPHMPFFGPRDAQYDPDGIPLPPNFEDASGEGCPLKHRLLVENYRRNGHSGLPLRTEDDWRRMIANYWGLCSLVDTHVGRILAELERLDLDEKTIVVFTSDHGDMMGAHRMLAKTVMFEEAVRVPMTVRLPGQREARRIAPPVSQVNLVPTLLELMGQEIPAELQGHSLVPSMFDESADGREPVIIEWNGANNGMAGGMEDGRALPDWALEMASPDRIARALQDPLRTVVDPSGWKLTVSTIGEHQLFHLGEDPWERYPRYGEPGTEPIVAKLRGALDAWRRKTGDRVGPTT